MHSPLIRAGAGVAGAVLLLLVALPLSAAAETAKVGNSEEAWFQAKKEFLAEPTGEDPTCELPTGCNVSGTGQRQNDQPEGVMAVAANAGDPDAQMFMNFNTEKLPLGAVVTGGKVTLPVARDPDARGRQLRPEDARMVACLVTGFIPDGTDAGSFKDRPTIDDKVCVPVKQEKEDPLIYSVDLKRFGKEWAGGAFMSGITLMVDPKIKSPAPEETWRVSFNTRRRAQQKTKEEKEQPEESRQEYPAITSTLQYKVVAGGGFGPALPEDDFDSGEDFGTTGDEGFDDGGGDDFAAGGDDFAAGGGGDGGFDSGGADTAPVDSGVIDAPQEAAAPPVEEPVAAEGAEQPVAAAPAAAAGPVGMSPAVWVMPLLALAMAAAMAWSLMHPVELVGQREGAVSKLMRTRRLNASTTSSTS